MSSTSSLVRKHFENTTMYCEYRYRGCNATIEEMLEYDYGPLQVYFI